MTQLVDADGDPATLPTALVNTRSYAYQYDQLNRLIDAQMGRFLTDSGGNIVPGTDGLPQIVQPGGGNGAPVPRTTHWTLDNLGNWAGGSVDGGVIVTPSVERLADWNNNGSADDFPEKTHHAVDNANEIAVLYQEAGNPPTGNPTALVYDSAGNLVYDGRYVFQYDAFNRLVQVNERGAAEFDEYGRAYLPGPLTVPPTPVLGDLICRYVYDGVGRLISKVTPINVGETNLQTKDFYYDGVRRIQERISRPGQMLHNYAPGTFVTEGGGAPGSGGVVENDELALKRADGEKPQQQIVEANIIVPLNEIWTDRAYIYGPNYVDEFVAQIDRYGNVIPTYVGMLQDANYNVVALVSGGGPGTPQPGGGTTPFADAGYVLEQYTYDPYGSAVASENFDIDAATGKSLHAVNRVGHQGLFFERFDGSYIDQTLAEGGLPSQLATARATGLYYNRNRFYHPQLGRFMTRDPNETGLPVNTDLAFHGEPITALLDGFSGQGLYGDGSNLFAYTGQNPVNGNDPNGLTHAYFDDGDWPYIVSGTGAAIDSALDTQGQMWARDWGDDDFGDAIRGVLEDRDGAIVVLTDAYARATRGLGLSKLYAQANFKWLQVYYDYISAEGGLGIQLNICEFEALVDFVECFGAGTLVATPDGVGVGIETIRPGDIILSTSADPAAQAVPVPARVTAVSSRTVGEFVTVTIGNDVLTVTPDHPFWVPEQGWCAASSLAPGTAVRTSTGLAEVDFVEECHDSLTVYNLEVRLGHTYFVGNGELLVHNTCTTQTHHIIPHQLADHEALSGLNFKMEGSSNKIKLNVTTHCGSHPKYTEIIRTRLDEIARETNVVRRAEAVERLQKSASRALRKLEQAGEHMREIRGIRRVRLP